MKRIRFTRKSKFMFMRLGDIGPDTEPGAIAQLLVLRLHPASFGKTNPLAVRLAGAFVPDPSVKPQSLPGMGKGGVRNVVVARAPNEHMCEMRIELLVSVVKTFGTSARVF